MNSKLSHEIVLQYFIDQKSDFWISNLNWEQSLTSFFTLISVGTQSTSLASKKVSERLRCRYLTRPAREIELLDVFSNSLRNLKRLNRQLFRPYYSLTHLSLFFNSAGSLYISTDANSFNSNIFQFSWIHLRITFIKINHLISRLNQWIIIFTFPLLNYN